MDIPVLGKLNAGYKCWHGYFIHLPKLTRHTLGVKIDTLFTDCLALTLQAKYTPKENKQAAVERVSVTFDSLKFFLQLLWEIGELEDKKYLTLSHHLAEIGNMIGGWINFFKKPTPPLR